MKIKEFWQRALYYLSVPTCVGCGERLLFDEPALCNACREKHIENKREECSVCHNPRPLCTCANEYLEKHRVKKLVKLFVYRSSADGKTVPSNELIYHIKRRNRGDVVRFLADELSSALKANLPDYKDYCVTNIPRSRSRVRKYGHDHAKMLAKAIASNLDIAYIPALRSRQIYVQKKQKSFESRIKNAKYSIDKNASVEGKKLILLDDVVTTGASMGACAEMLKKNGAKRIVGACIGIAFKDKYRPFPKDSK